MYFLEELDVMLCLFYLKDEPAKVIKKRIIKLCTRASAFLQKGALGVVYNSKDPQKTIRELLSPQLIYAQQIQEMCETNHDGFVTIGKDILPLMLVVETEEDMAWTREPANEGEIALSFATATMNHLNLKHIVCRVTLFKHQGFSGTAYPFELKVDGRSPTGKTRYSA